MQSEMVRFPWQGGAPSSLSVQTESFFCMAGGEAPVAAAISWGSASTARPCIVEFTIIGAHVWQYDVCWELLQVSSVISWHAAERERCCLNKQAKLSLMKYQNTQQEVAHKQTRSSIWCKLLFWTIWILDMHAVFKCWGCLGLEVTQKSLKPQSGLQRFKRVLTIWRFFKMLLWTTQM